MYYHATPCHRLHDHEFNIKPNQIKKKRKSLFSNIKNFFYKFIYKT